jgi:hypothetical protein
VRLRGAWKKGLCSRSGYLASEGGGKAGPEGTLKADWCETARHKLRARSKSSLGKLLCRATCDVPGWVGVGRTHEGAAPR